MHNREFFDQPFSRNIKVIKFCKGKLPNGKTCSIEYNPQTRTLAYLGFCYTHRKQFYKKIWRKYGKPYQRIYGKTPARKAKQYIRWRKWVTRNIDKRRLIALKSYHRHKDEHRHRKQQATGNVP